MSKLAAISFFALFCLGTVTSVVVTGGATASRASHLSKPGDCRGNSCHSRQPTTTDTTPTTTDTTPTTTTTATTTTAPTTTIAPATTPTTTTVVTTSADTSPPSTPGGLSVSGATVSAVSLAWGASTDDVGVAGYDVYKAGVLVGQTASTSYSVTGLSCGTSYSFAVDAYDAAGNHSGNATVSGSTSACPVSADPSGQAAPVGDISGWHQIYVDNFANENVPLGTTCGDPNGFPHKLSNWDAYPYPWKGTPTWGTYCPERTTSIHDGIMDIWLHSESVNGTMMHLIDAPMPKIAGYTNTNGQLYGRYVIRYEEPTSFPMFHVSWLLWPNSGVWPGDGEIDYPEADTSSSTTSAFMHWQGGTSGGSQDAYTTATPMYGAWHTAVIEWLPSRVTFILDGKVIGNSTDTSKIPDTPMHFVIQNGGSFGVSSPDNTSQGHIYIDWVAIYAPA